MSEMKGVTYGSDPEFFVVNNSKARCEVWTQDMGSKGNPMYIRMSRRGGHLKREFRELDLPAYGVLRDGVCLELNIKPARTPYLAYARIHAAYDDYNRRLQGHRYSLKTGSQHTFKAAALKSAPSDVNEIGCAVDYDAYSDTPEEPRAIDDIKKLYDKNIRFAGGHVHLGYPPNNIPKWVVARLIDLFTCPYRPYSTENNRLYTYGRPGLYRPTSYGIEYRTPCPIWARNKQAAAKLFQGMNAVAYVIENENLVKTIWEHINWPEFKAAHQMGYYGEYPLEYWLFQLCEEIKELGPVLGILQEDFGEQPMVFDHVEGLARQARFINRPALIDVQVPQVHWAAAPGEGMLVDIEGNEFEVDEFEPEQGDIE